MPDSSATSSKLTQSSGSTGTPTQQPTLEEVRSKWGPEYPVGPFPNGSHIYDPSRPNLTAHCQESNIPSDSSRFRLCDGDFAGPGAGPVALTMSGDLSWGNFVSGDRKIKGTWVSGKGQHKDTVTQWTHANGLLRGEGRTWVDGAAKGSRYTLCGPNGPQKGDESRNSGEFTHQQEEHWIMPPYGDSIPDPDYHTSASGPLLIRPRK